MYGNHMFYQIECVSSRIRPKREDQKNVKKHLKKTSKNMYRKRDAKKHEQPSKMEAQIEKKTIENEFRKLMRKKGRMPRSAWRDGGMWRAPS